MTAYDRLMLPENLNYAWNKAKRLYWTFDGYTDNAEISEFELNLEQRLITIRKRFEKGFWRPRKLRPLPRPKKLVNNVPSDRQYYHVAVDDQVAWIAVANVLGPELDQRMPPWSYGNRIYRPAWYEESEGQKSTLEIGPYRHASGYLYRKFQHSWPLFRRHVALTARTMARTLPPDLEDLDEADRLAAISANKAGLLYLRKSFWRPQSRSFSRTTLYHASIDLRHFYPSLQAEAVLRGLSCSDSIDARFRNLLIGMLKFSIDRSKMPPDTMKRVDPKYDGLRVRGIPTGLFVAGFLANAAMLPVDRIVNSRVNDQRSLAHFRYVDDHIFLAYDFDELCEWIYFYHNLLSECDTGVHINPEKYNPISLAKWMQIRPTTFTATKQPTGQIQNSEDEVREAAVRNTEIDGANPTPLLTKTLGQISALATANVDIMDDEDLEERLRQLEWLLLANIPEREIRPDTRAAFAAGQIASLAPILVREADGLVEAARSLEGLKARAPNAEIVSDAEIREHAASVERKDSELALLVAEQRDGEQQLLRHCFELLLRAFREYPGKPRLFFRIHEYCRITGFRGLQDIGIWITEMRANGYNVWADYYAGLSLQILARGMLLATRSWLAEDVLRSDREAAQNHLEDICRIDRQAFLLQQENEAWYHAVGRTEFAIALLVVAEIVRDTSTNSGLTAGLEDLAGQYANISFDHSEDTWERETAHRPGVWAHLSESILSIDDNPTASWKQFESRFSFSHLTEIQATRRYPEFLSDEVWYELLHSKKPLPETDSGWLREAMYGNNHRVNAAHSSRGVALTRAARSLRNPTSGYITLAEWTREISQTLSPFDPRRSEWTALEIVRQLVSPIVHDLSIHETRLDRLHPNNVLVPETWMKTFRADRDRAGVSWETWRAFAGEAPSTAIMLREPATSVMDYRYFTETHKGGRRNEWDRRLVGVGRLLLGLLRLKHDAPRIWNIRGNEQVFSLPRTHWFRSLAISSSTLLLIEGCLGTRSAETRSIALIPGLFGWVEGVAPNDANFDPPLLLGTNELLAAIKHSQNVLIENQLAVAMNQPRQIIPFRLSDFATGSETDREADGYAE